MNKKKEGIFYEEFATLVGVQRSSISSNTKLSDLEWDSMALISTMALIDEIFEIVVAGDQLSDCITIGDILLLVKD